MKTRYGVGDKVVIKEMFGTGEYKDEIRKLAGAVVTIRSCSLFGYYIKETEGMAYDEMWNEEDFEVNKEDQAIKTFNELVTKERDRQDSLWGVQHHDWCTWSTILTEECGEVAKACLEVRFESGLLSAIEEELVQVAAVSKAIWEHIQEYKKGKIIY